ncbi:hypothetical protein MC45_13105 [Sphingomonas taxi]|uniref:MarR family transcriptional regulator n=2 Tax=Sphingomonas taxi TaxID=1549858 RepID=A0A097EHV4_9SPHN|nr:hypothetical protein MC45_13105 [Sphingomonas taxi]
MGITTLADAKTERRPARPYGDRGHPMLLIADATAAAPFHAAIDAVGARLLQRIGWAEVAGLLPRLGGRPVFAVEARDVAAATLDAVLPLLADHLAAEEGRAVLALATAQIDLVARHLLGERIELLCDPSPAQRVVALAEACRRMPPTLQEGLSDTVRSDREPFLHPGRESDEERLRRLTDGMARISRFAADFVHNQPVTGASELGDRRTRFDGEPAIGHAVRPQDVRRVIHRRQLRSKFFGQFGGEALFEDPAWDMLLDLFAAELEGVQVSVSSLCIAAGVAPTTALRWIAKMTEMELFIRHPDPADRRRAFMTLSPRASEAMQAYMIALRKIEAAG